MDVRDVRSVYVLERVMNDESSTPILVSEQWDAVGAEIAYHVDWLRGRSREHLHLRERRIEHEVFHHGTHDFHVVMVRGVNEDGVLVSVPIREYRVSIVDFEPAREEVTA